MFKVNSPNLYMKRIKSFPTFIRSLEHPKPKNYFSISDMLILLIFLFLGLFSRSFRIAFPPNRVFDEAHFGHFTNQYVKRLYFHDIHPPLGKLLLALMGYLTGYDGQIDFKGDDYKDLHYYSLRSVPSTFSALIPPASFLSMRIFGYSTIASILVAIYLTTESMLIVESHLILIDGFLHAFTVLTILGVSMLDSNPYSKFALIFASLMGGCTFSIKYTGLSVLVFFGAQQFIYYSKSSLVYFFNVHKLDKKPLVGYRSKLRNIISMIKINSKIIFKIPFVKLIGRMLIVLIISFTVMFLTFIIHIIILDYKGEGDGFMPNIFRQTLVYKHMNDMSARTCCMSMRKRVMTLIHVMHRSNMGITASHSASSKWYDWPLARMKSIAYYTRKYHLVLFATPIIWYTAAIGPIICLFLAGFGYFFGNVGLTKLIIWPAGYYASWIPFCLIPRVLFVYHYLVPLIFGCFSFAAALDVLLSNYKKWKSSLFVLIAALTITMYIFFAPWMYAMANFNWGIRTWKSKMF